MHESGENSAIMMLLCTMYTYVRTILPKERKQSFRCQQCASKEPLSIHWQIVTLLFCGFRVDETQQQQQRQQHQQQQQQYEIIIIIKNDPLQLI